MELPKHIEEQVSARAEQYGSAVRVLDAAMEALSERERAEAELEALLVAGLESGPDEDMTKADWADLRRPHLERLERMAAHEPSNKPKD